MSNNIVEDSGGDDDDTKTALEAWINRLVKTRACTASRALQARQHYDRYVTNQMAEKQKETVALKGLAAILPKKADGMTVHKICVKLIAYLQDSNPMAENMLRKYLQPDKGFHPSSLADDGMGYFLWAVSYGLGNSRDPGKGPTLIFLALLKILVEDHGISVDQRGTREGSESINPLQYVVKSGQPKAVRAMLEYGANVNLRDDEGWTALHAICMNDVKSPAEGGPSVQDRVETARLLCKGGAELEAENYMGLTPLLAACISPCLPLLEFLLSSGANRNHRSQNGWGAIFLLEDCKRDWNKEVIEECIQLLKGGGSITGNNVMGEESKIVQYTRLMNSTLLPINNSFLKESNCGPDSVKDRAKQERRVLQELFKHFDMDPDLLTKQFSNTNQMNWIEEVHYQIINLVPVAYQKIYRGQLPSDEELAILMTNSRKAMYAGATGISEGPRSYDKEEAVKSVLVEYRERGVIYSEMHNYVTMIVDPIQHCVGFAIPNEAVLEKIAQYGPKIVEVGAGTGYWTAVLQSRGVDIIAYDAIPPENKHHSSPFFDTTFTTVHKRDATTTQFWSETISDTSDRALLIVWPNNADELDNSHLYDGEFIPPVWGADCLSKYIESGGNTVIYIGEREDKIKVNTGCKPDCGISSSRLFQNMLKEQFDLVEQVDIPTWYRMEDDATIWKLKT